MLALLYNAPVSEQDWNVWSLSHAASHKKIIQAILAQKKSQLNIYQLDPIALNRIADFLDRNQQAHNEMNGTLGISGSDLQSVDMNDNNQRSAWIALHAREHLDVEQALGI